MDGTAEKQMHGRLKRRGDRLIVAGILGFCCGAGLLASVALSPIVGIGVGVVLFSGMLMAVGMLGILGAKQADERGATTTAA